LKPANFVFVKGHLKLIDFGIAKSFSSDTTNIYRESQIGTVSVQLLQWLYCCRWWWFGCVNLGRLLTVFAGVVVH
jgi:hypothetical protein